MMMLSTILLLIDSYRIKYSESFSYFTFLDQQYNKLSYKNIIYSFNSSLKMKKGVPISLKLLINTTHAMINRSSERGLVMDQVFDEHSLLVLRFTN